MNESVYCCQRPPTNDVCARMLTCPYSCSVLRCQQEMIDIIETVYRGAKKGRGMVVSPKDYSTKYKY